VSTDAVQALARAFQVVLSPGTDVQPGQPLAAKLVPPAELTVPGALPADIDLTLVAKNVRFTKVDLADPDLLGGAPFIRPVGATADALSAAELPVTGDDAVQGVPGLIGKLQGTIPLPINVPVELKQVEWSVLDDAGTALSPGVDYLAPTGLTSLDVSFTFPPPDVVELALGQQLSPVTRFIRATVTLATGPDPADEKTVDLPDVPIAVFPLQVPTVLALFRNRHFAAVGPGPLNLKGFVLLVVPSNAQLTTLEGLISGLGAVQTAAQLLALLSAPAALPDLKLAGLPPVIAELTNAIAEHSPGSIKIRAADQLPDLSDIRMFSGGPTADCRISSLIFIGPPNRAVNCFTRANFKRRELDVICRDELAAVIRVLGAVHCDPGQSVPSSGDFGNSLSSLRFAVDGVTP
jgi:hypothetical protein